MELRFEVLGEFGGTLALRFVGFGLGLKGFSWDWRRASTTRRTITVKSTPQVSIYSVGVPQLAFFLDDQTCRAIDEAK